MASLKLVNFRTSDGLRLDGLLAMPDIPPVALVVHVHGKCGNFYQNDFIASMIEGYPANGFGFLAFNNRGHDCLGEAYFVDRLEYVGGSVEHFSDSLLDIDGALLYGGTVCDTIVLQGHSNGCEKVMLWAATEAALGRVQNTVEACILLSPSDSGALQEKYTGQELSAQYNYLESLNSKQLEEWLRPSAYGIATAGKHYQIPVTGHSLKSLFEDGGFSVLRYDSPSDGYRKSPLPCIAYYGGADPYQTVPLEMAEAFLRRRFSSLTTIFEQDADHHFAGIEGRVVERLAKALKKVLC